jgi:hypothetical protein
MERETNMQWIVMDIRNGRQVSRHASRVAAETAAWVSVWWTAQRA